MSQPPRDPPLFSFFNEIGIIEQLGRAQFEQVLPDGLKLSQFTVLNHFARRGGEESPAQLANAFQVTRGAMTNTLQRLEARGLIAIRPDPADGRAKLVSLTDQGRAVREASIAALGPALARLAAAFPPERFAAALPFLQEVRAFLDADRDRPAATRGDAQASSSAGSPDRSANSS